MHQHNALRKRDAIKIPQRMKDNDGADNEGETVLFVRDVLQSFGEETEAVTGVTFFAKLRMPECHREFFRS
jgi:hypothetical protein